MCNDCKMPDAVTPPLTGEFKTLPEARLDHTYIELLNAYNAGILEAAVTALGAVDYQIGRIRPALIPNPEGKMGTKPMVRIKRIMETIKTLTGDIERLRVDCRDTANIPDNPLKKGK